MDDETENVVPLGTKAKPEDKRGLRVIRYKPGGCNHRKCTYYIDEGEAEVTCGDCGSKLDPLWVLRELCEAETRWNQASKEYRELLAEVKDRTRTRCQHCDQMTAINTKGRMRGLR